MLYRIVKDLFFWALVVSLLALIPTLFSFLFFDGVDGYYFCQKRDCVRDLFEKKGYIFEVFEFSFYAFAVAAAVFQLQQNKDSQKIQYNSLHVSNCLSHLNEFRSLVEHEMKWHNDLNDRCVCSLKMHMVLFPDMSLLGPAGDAGDTHNGFDLENNPIEDLRILVEEVHNNFGLPDGTEFEFEAHKKEIKKRLRNIGIHIDDLTQDAFFRVEEDAIKFINSVLLTFYPEAKTIREYPSYR